jgi:hypothetical protein
MRYLESFALMALVGISAYFDAFCACRGRLGSARRIAPQRPILRPIPRPRLSLTEELVEAVNDEGLEGLVDVVPTTVTVTVEAQWYGRGN